MANETCPPLSIFKCKIESTIPFHLLPLLVQVQAIRTMSPKDWINLAMTSKRNERVVKLAGIKMESPCVEVSQSSCIHLSSLKLKLYYGFTFWKTEKWEIMTRKDMRPWLNQPFRSMMENAGILYQKIQNLFVLPKDALQISFCTDFPTRATIRELLSNPNMKNWRELSIDGKNISSEDLKMIMDTATLDRTFKSAVKEMPLDFKHKNAFKFLHQAYCDARWVQLEDLCGLRNMVKVLLGLNRFTQEQLKYFVNYWVDSEVDMFEQILIMLKERLNFENLVDGLLGLQGSDPDSKQFLTLSKSSSSSRKQTMLIISYDAMEEHLFLRAWDVNEKYTPSKNEEEDKKFENVGTILTILHKKKELEDVGEVESGEAKMELSRKINESIAELSALNVVFIDGKATHALF